MKFYDCITEFIFLEHEPEQADMIFVPGGNYPDSARYAAQLYAQGWAPYVMPSGKYSILKGKFEAEIRIEDYLDDTKRKDVKYEEILKKEFATEWEYLKTILMCEGVPEQAILKEDEATYTYENAIYSRKKLEKMGISVKKAILCCQAFHARRSLMYYQEQFPDTEFLVCPVVTKGISRENWYQTEHGVKTVLGEMERCGTQFHEIMKKYR